MTIGMHYFTRQVPDLIPPSEWKVGDRFRFTNHPDIPPTHRGVEATIVGEESSGYSGRLFRFLTRDSGIRGGRLFRKEMASVYCERLDSSAAPTVQAGPPTFCHHWPELRQYAEPNLPNGGFKCWECRNVHG